MNKTSNTLNKKTKQNKTGNRSDRIFWYDKTRFSILLLIIFTEYFCHSRVWVSLDEYLIERTAFILLYHRSSCIKKVSQGSVEVICNASPCIFVQRILAQKFNKQKSCTRWDIRNKYFCVKTVTSQELENDS